MIRTQKPVAARMAAALATSVVVFGVAFGLRWCLPESQSGRSAPACSPSRRPGRRRCWRCPSVGSGEHRFHASDDIQGSAVRVGSERARRLRALLQNTLEQTALAVSRYAAYVAVRRAKRLAGVPAAALLFVVGRVLFFVGYADGAAGRAYGFAPTFYPTLLAAVIASAFSVIGHGA